ncbi:MAG: DPP IV N-terminal domain-containing protein, partial [Rubripirellula sp.]
YHPEHKFDFDGELPATHWIEDGESKLLIRREAWNQVDLTSGQETPWPVVDDIARQLRSLGGLQPEQAKSAAMNAVPKMKSSRDSVLIKFGKSLAIVSPNTTARWLTRDSSGWQNTTLGPLAKRVAYTRDGDLFVVDVATGRLLQLTNDGTETILDGILDWTYQEEIFGRGNYRGFWFSPDGQWLAMLRIDIGGIEPYTLADASGDRGKGLVRRYPKAGDPIPHASLYVWDLRRIDSGLIPPAKLVATSTPQEERIITGVWWNPDQLQLLFSISDRQQKWREVRSLGSSFLSGERDTATVLLREESPAWIEPPVSPGWLRDGSFIWRSELPTGRTRLYQISPGAKFVTPLTPADFDVRKFWLDPQGEFVIVTGDQQTVSMESQVYRIDLNRTQQPATLVPVTKETGWHAVETSPDARWIVDRFSTEAKPPSLWLRSTLRETSMQLAESASKLPPDMRAPEVFHIRTADGTRLPAMLIRPQGQSPVPVVIEVYGGPQSPVVTRRWGGTKALYRELLARRGIATLLVDNRSSGGRGLADTWPIRGRVGEIEFADVMAAVEWLKEQPWVDQESLAIRGWSFGGFLTLYAMTHSKDFAAGIAGGSVTDWAEYDAFYTERYMGLPAENVAGYRSTAPVEAADQLHGEVMLIHGESDDNVHPSGTLRMAAALQEAGKPFQLMIYPGAAHAIRDPQQAWHLAQITDRFLDEELPRDPKEGEKTAE